MNIAQHLIQLQEIDLQLMKYEKDLQKLSQHERKKHFDLAEKKCKRYSVSLFGVVKDLKADLLEIQSKKNQVSTKTKEVLAQMNSSSDHREIKNIQAQLSMFAKEAEKLEFKEKKLRLQLEENEKALQNSQRLLEKLQGEKQDFESQVARATQHVLKQFQGLKASRETLIQRIPQSSLAAYDFGYKKYNGLCVEVLEGTVPSVCKKPIPNSHLYEVTHATQTFVTCPNCKRMLVVNTQEEDEQ